VEAYELAFQQTISELRSNHSLIVVLYPSHTSITLNEAYTKGVRRPSDSDNSHVIGAYASCTSVTPNETCTQDAHRPSLPTQQNSTHVQSDSDNSHVVGGHPSRTSVTIKEAYIDEAHTPPVGTLRDDGTRAHTQGKGTGVHLHAQMAADLTLETCAEGSQHNFAGNRDGINGAKEENSDSAQNHSCIPRQDLVIESHDADSDSRQSNAQGNAAGKERERPEQDLTVIVLDGTWTQANSLNRRVDASIQRVKLGESVCVDAEKAEDASPLRKQKVSLCLHVCGVCMLVDGKSCVCGCAEG
jgi:hypothetical protein